MQRERERNKQDGGKDWATKVKVGEGGRECVCKIKNNTNKKKMTTKTPMEQHWDEKKNTPHTGKWREDDPRGRERIKSDN